MCRLCIYIVLNPMCKTNYFPTHSFCFCLGGYRKRKQDVLSRSLLQALWDKVKVLNSSNKKRERERKSETKRVWVGGSICLLPHREHAACLLPRACPWVPPAFLHAALESPAGRMAHPLEVLGHFSNTALHFNSIHLASKFCILVSGTILETPWRSQEVPVP